MPTITETGALPSGVTFTDNKNWSASLGGKPAAGTSGNYPIMITATNGVGSPANQNFTLTVGQSPTITSANSTTFTVGLAGSFTVTATGPPTPSLSESGALPTGVTFKDNGNGTATLSGTPAAGTGKKYTLTLTASNGVGSPANQTFTLTVNQTPAIASASSTTFTVGSAGSFTVTTTGFPTPSIGESGALPSGVNFKDNGNGTATLSGTPAAGTAGSYTLMFTPSNGVGSPAAQNFTLTVNTAPPPSNVNVLTYHNDNARTGLNPNETILTTANVNQATFKNLGSFSVAGLVDAEPLYVSHLTIGGASHNVLYVATEHDMLYAFDADTLGLPPLWQVSLIPGTEMPSDARSCSQVVPEIGITSTPAIDLGAGPNGAIYVVTMSKAGSTYHQRLHAIDLVNHTELFGGPVDISATYPGTGTGSSSGSQTFNPASYEERAALLLQTGVIYTTWTSHCDNPNYTSWVISYSASTLQQLSILNLTANGATQNGQEGGIWMSGDGPAADSAGNIYFLIGNGTFETTLNANGFPNMGDYGNCFMKISTTSNKLAVADYFAMNNIQGNAETESSADIDLGSGGEMLLPDITDSGNNVHQLAVGAGKDSNMYIVDRNSLGRFKSNDSGIYQRLDGVFPNGVWSSPAYFNNTVYYGSKGSSLMAFPISPTTAKLATSPSTSSTHAFAYPGTTPSISSNGTSNGIVWTLEAGSTGVLRAYDATNLATELYDSNQAGSRDQFPSSSDDKFVTPMIANGKVYVGTPNAVFVFGLF